MKLESDRLVLSPIDLSDLSDIHLLHSLPETDRYNTLGIPKDIEETKEIIVPWIAEHDKEVVTKYTFKIESKKEVKFIGLFGLTVNAKKTKRAEIWYKIHKDYWGNGFGTEAVKLVLDFCFEDLGLHRIEAGCAVDNIASIKLLEKIGMTKEGRKRKVLPLVTGWSDNFEFAILHEDWNDNQLK